MLLTKSLISSQAAAMTTEKGAPNNYLNLETLSLESYFYYEEI